MVQCRPSQEQTSESSEDKLGLRLIQHKNVLIYIWKVIIESKSY